MQIANDFELMVTKNRLAEFEAARISVIEKWGNQSMLAKIVLDALVSMINDLEHQIDDYSIKVPPVQE